MLRLLRDGVDIAEDLADLIEPKLKALSASQFATSSELHSRFFQEGESLIYYAGLNTFFGGLEGHWRLSQRLCWRYARSTLSAKTRPVSSRHQTMAS